MLKVYEKIQEGYNLYCFRKQTKNVKKENWCKVNNKIILDFNLIDEDAITTTEFITSCFYTRDFDKLDNFINFIKENNY
jgi:hypothetical protein